MRSRAIEKVLRLVREELPKRNAAEQVFRLWWWQPIDSSAFRMVGLFQRCQGAILLSTFRCSELQVQLWRVPR